MHPIRQARLERLGTLLARDGFDGLVVSDLANIRYLTAFSGTWARLVLGPRHAALDAAIAAVRPGQAARAVALAAHEVVARAGMRIPHDVGHGVGLEVHEEPRIAPYSDAILEEGMVLALEPGIYRPGWGGVRLEDLVVVTAGGARTLTAARQAIV